MATATEQTRWVTVGPDLRIPQALLGNLTTPNAVGIPSFVILEYDGDATDVPNGTFIARLPEGYVP
jgi:hypothetical protein